MEIIRNVIKGMIDEQGRFRKGNLFVDKIFTLKQIGEKATVKNRRAYVGFMDLKKIYDRANRENQ